MEKGEGPMGMRSESLSPGPILLKVTNGKNKTSKKKKKDITALPPPFVPPVSQEGTELLPISP